MRTVPPAALPTTVDGYIATFPPGAQKKMEQVRNAIRASAPDAVEAIKYRMPTYVLNGNLVHFAAFKNHIGFYPGPGAIARFKDEFSAYKSSPGAVQFPLTGPMPVALIKKIVKSRVEEALAQSPPLHRPAKSQRKTG